VQLKRRKLAENFPTKSKASASMTCDDASSAANYQGYPLWKRENYQGQKVILNEILQSFHTNLDAFEANDALYKIE